MGVLKHNAKLSDNNEIKYISFGIGTNKKEGEQKACKMALIIFGLLKDDQYVQEDIFYPPWDRIKKFDGTDTIIE